MWTKGCYMVSTILFKSRGNTKSVVSTSFTIAIGSSENVLGAVIKVNKHMTHV
jgi:hypothetical protein